jgi:Histidine kinase
MYRTPGVLSPAPAVRQVRPTPGLSTGSPQSREDGRVTGPAEVILSQAEDRERIAQGLNDVVVRRLLTTGQDLQTTLGLIGDHPAGGKIRHAMDEMNQAIQGIRDTVFDHPAGERPPLGTSTGTT